MRWWFRPRSRCFRIVLGMALLAWTAFAFDAFAHPLVMSAAQTSHASATMAGMTAMAMPDTTHATAPVQPIGNGHGCCQNAHCYCAFFCSGIAAAPGVAATVAPPQGPTFVAVGNEPVPTRFTLLLRPPIA